MSGADETVGRLQEDYWKGLAEEPSKDVGSAVDQYLVFRLVGRLFAFETRHCRQVFRVPRVVPLPEVPRFLCGVINVRGRIVSVTDLGLLLEVSAEPSRLDGRLIVVSDGRQSTAMAVDAVDRILDLPREQVQEPGSGGPGGAAVAGEVLLDQQLVVLLSVPALFALPALQIEYRRNEG